MDDRSWYPLGRIVGGTAYPGLMATSYFFHKILNFFHFTIQVRNMCVFIAPIFAAATAIASYLLTYEVFFIILSISKSSSPLASLSNVLSSLYS